MKTKGKWFMFGAVSVGLILTWIYGRDLGKLQGKCENQEDMIKGLTRIIERQGFIIGKQSRK